MAFKTRKKTIYEIDCYDLQRWVRNAWPSARPWRLACAHECSGGENVRFFVSNFRIDRLDQEELDEFTSGNSDGEWMGGYFLDAFCRMGCIPAGEYIINVRL